MTSPEKLRELIAILKRDYDGHDHVQEAAAMLEQIAVEQDNAAPQTVTNHAPSPGNAGTHPAVAAPYAAGQSVAQSVRASEGQTPRTDAVSKKWLEILSKEGMSYCLGEIGELYTHARQLERELAEWRTWRIVEIVVRNTNVKSYVEHWEGRALKAEAALKSTAHSVHASTGEAMTKSEQMMEMAERLRCARIEEIADVSDEAAAMLEQIAAEQVKADPIFKACTQQLAAAAPNAAGQAPNKAETPSATQDTPAPAALTEGPTLRTRVIFNKALAVAEANKSGTIKQMLDAMLGAIYDDVCQLERELSAAKREQEPVAWIATKDDGANLRFSVSDGWKVEPTYTPRS